VKSERVAIVGGCGHVGLPLGIVLAEAGYRTFLYDHNAALVNQVNSKVMPHLEEEAPQRLERVISQERLIATTDPSVLADCSIVFITIGTPVDEHFNPRVGDLLTAMHRLHPHLSAPGQLIIFRSTLAPGVLRSIAEQLKDLGCPAEIAYCPERIAQGKALTEIKGFPQLISGLSEQAIERCRQLFLELTEAEPIVLEPLEAELAKLFCNAWRYINFAISNQFYQIAEGAGVSFARIHDAATNSYPRMKEFARAGLTAGPCLLKDTMQLAAFCQNTFFLGHSAMLVNEGLPGFLVNQLLARTEGSLRRKKVGLLGLAFKPDNDDTRESLSFKLRKLLLQQGAEVLCHDPFVNQTYFPHLEFAELDEILARCDGLVIGVPHSLYRQLQVPPHIPVVDVWDSLPRQETASR
jgi:UDP-N-acetyl-D-mannosaminuronic acid dehydrogenase